MSDFAVFAARTHDYFALMNQRGAAESPFLTFVAGLGCAGLIAWSIGGQSRRRPRCCAAKPDCQIEGRGNSGCPRRPGHTPCFQNGRSCPRAFTGDGGVVVAGVFREPKHLAGLDVITNGGLVFLSLLLRDRRCPAMAKPDHAAPMG